MDRRDLLLDQLSQYGQISVEQLDGGSTNVSFVDGTNGTAYPIVSDQTADWAGPPAGGWSPGRPDGRPARGRQGRAARSTATWRTIDSFASSLASAVNGAYGGTFFTTGAPAGATHLRLGPDPGRAGEHHLRHRRRRLQRHRPGDLAAARQRGHRRRLQGVRGQGRRRPQRGHPHAGQRPGAGRLRREPPPERGRASRWTRRCPTSCASSVPTRPPRAPCRRWTRCWTSSSTAPEGSVSRPCASPPPWSSATSSRTSTRCPSQLAKTQAKAASSKEITRPSDDPFKAAQAMGLRSSIGANEQYVRNIQDARAGWTRPSPRWTRSPQYVNRAHDARAAGRHRHLRRDVAQGHRHRDRPDHPGHQGDARTPPTATSTS